MQGKRKRMRLMTKAAAMKGTMENYDGGAHDLEVLDGLMCLVNGDRKRFERAFMDADTDGSGQLGPLELQRFFQKKCFLFLGQIEMRRLFKNLDLDGSGEIGMAEMDEGDMAGYICGRRRCAF